MKRNAGLIELQKKAMRAIHQRPALSRRSFLNGQASDPVLAASSAPYQSMFGAPIQKRPRRRK